MRLFFRPVLMSLLLSLSLICPFPAFAEGQQTILLVAFGTSVEAARASYTHVEECVRKAFPEAEIRWAWTARSLLSSWRDDDRLSPEEALAKLAAEGRKHVDILSLHIIPGEEYNNLRITARAFEGLPKGLERVHMAPPLLCTTESLEAVAKLLLQTLPPERKRDEAVLFVGHGTHHPSGVYYPALQYYLGQLDSNALVGTIEAGLPMETVLEALKARGVRTVWLVPLMTVAGDHAIHDLFGAEKENWGNTLEARGFRVHEVRKGLGEYPAVAQQWVDGLLTRCGE